MWNWIDRSVQAFRCSPKTGYIYRMFLRKLVLNEQKCLFFKMISLFLPFYDDIVVNLKHDVIIKLPSLVTQTSIYAEETDMYVPIVFIGRTVVIQYHCHSFFFADIEDWQHCVTAPPSGLVWRVLHQKWGISIKKNKGTNIGKHLFVGSGWFHGKEGAWPNKYTFQAKLSMIIVSEDFQLFLQSY